MRKTFFSSFPMHTMFLIVEQTNRKLLILTAGDTIANSLADSLDYTVKLATLRIHYPVGLHIFAEVKFN